MITEAVLVDTGPLVALLNDRDLNHHRCHAQATLLVGQVYTSWPVITEAAWLLRQFPGSTSRVLDLIVDGPLTCLNLEAEDLPGIQAMAAKYADLSPQLADLSLITLADHHDIQVVFTLDRRDFNVYRTASGRSLRILPDSE